MTDPDRDQELQALFAAAKEDLDGRDFSREVRTGTQRLRRRRIARRASVALGLSLLAMPMQDVALAVSQLMIVSLVELEAGLVAELLAPINSVGGLLSAVLLVLRLAHKRLFN